MGLGDKLRNLKDLALGRGGGISFWLKFGGPKKKKGEKNFSPLPKLFVLFMLLDFRMHHKGERLPQLLDIYFCKKSSRF